MTGAGPIGAEIARSGGRNGGSSSSSGLTRGSPLARHCDFSCLLRGGGAVGGPQDKPEGDEKEQFVPPRIGYFTAQEAPRSSSRGSDRALRDMVGHRIARMERDDVQPDLEA